MTLDEPTRARLLEVLPFALELSKFLRFVGSAVGDEVGQPTAAWVLERAVADGWLPDLLDAVFGTLELQVVGQVQPVRLVRGEGLTLGSGSDNGLILKENSVAEHHARVFAKGDGFAVEALGTQRVKLKGKSVAGGALVAGGRLGLGDVVIQCFEVASPYLEDDAVGQAALAALPVQVSTSVPEAAEPGEEFTARLVIAHPDQAVAADAVAAGAGGTAVSDRKPMAWVVGTVVEVHVYGEHMVVEPAQQTFTWDGQLHALDFDVRIAAGVPTGVSQARLKFDLFLVSDALPERLSIGRVRRQLGIGPAVNAVGQPEVSRGAAFKSAYASFDLVDGAAVLPRLDALRQACGLLVFPLKYNALADPERQALFEKAIGDRDQFYLFWSTAAAQSEAVKWEWLTALKQRGLGRMEVQLLPNAPALPTELAALEVRALATPPLPPELVSSPDERLKAHPTQIQLEAMPFRRDEGLAHRWFKGALETARSIARLEVSQFVDGKKGSPSFGTGWLLTPGLLLTNFHVIECRLGGMTPATPEDMDRQVASVVGKFDYYAEADVGKRVKGFSLVAWNRALDYAVLRLAKPMAGRKGLAIAPRRDEPLPQGARVNIVQHAEGLEVTFAVRTNYVVALPPALETEPLLHYLTGTKRGSSGSPVLDDSWHVVGLHHGSIRKNGDTDVWFDALGQPVAETAEYHNEGILIHAVLDHLPAEVRGEVPNPPAG